MSSKTELVGPEPLGRWAFRRPSDNMSASETLAFAQYSAWWWFFPNGFWTEADGSHVLFDEWKRPICRKKPDGSVEILRSNVKTKHISERFLYDGYNASEKLTTVKHCLELVERLGLREEIEYRLDISEAGGLPGGALL